MNRVEMGSAEHILNVVQGWNGRNSIPLAEARMDSEVLAAKIRKQFAAKKRGGHDFGKIYMANSTTLGTRVRVEILKAIDAVQDRPFSDLMDGSSTVGSVITNSADNALVA